MMRFAVSNAWKRRTGNLQVMFRACGLSCLAPRGLAIMARESRAEGAGGREGPSPSRALSRTLLTADVQGLTHGRACSLLFPSVPPRPARLRPAPPRVRGPELMPGPPKDGCKQTAMCARTARKLAGTPARADPRRRASTEDGARSNASQLCGAKRLEHPRAPRVQARELARGRCGGPHDAMKQQESTLL